MISMRLVGFNALTSAFRKAGGRVKKQAHQNLAKAGGLVKGAIQLKLTNDVLHIRTGRLRGSVGAVFVNPMAIKVGPQRVFYAAIHEFGLGGMKRRPYVLPSFQENQERIKKILGASFEGVLS